MRKVRTSGSNGESWAKAPCTPGKPSKRVRRIDPLWAGIGNRPRRSPTTESLPLPPLLRFHRGFLDLVETLEAD
jgi:hypothetical protein